MTQDGASTIWRSLAPRFQRRVANRLIRDVVDVGGHLLPGDPELVLATGCVTRLNPAEGGRFVVNVDVVGLVVLGRLDLLGAWPGSDAAAPLRALLGAVKRGVTGADLRSWRAGLPPSAWIASEPDADPTRTWMGGLWREEWGRGAQGADVAAVLPDLRGSLWPVLAWRLGQRRAAASALECDGEPDAEGYVERAWVARRVLEDGNLTLWLLDRAEEAAAGQLAPWVDIAVAWRALLGDEERATAALAHLAPADAAAEELIEAARNLLWHLDDETGARALVARASSLARADWREDVLLDAAELALAWLGDRALASSFAEQALERCGSSEDLLWALEEGRGLGLPVLEPARLLLLAEHRAEGPAALVEIARQWGQLDEWTEARRLLRDADDVAAAGENAIERARAWKDLFPVGPEARAALAGLLDGTFGGRLDHAEALHQELGDTAAAVRTLEDCAPASNLQWARLARAWDELPGEAPRARAARGRIADTPTDTIIVRLVRSWATAPAYLSALHVEIADAADLTDAMRESLAAVVDAAQAGRDPEDWPDAALRVDGEQDAEPEGGEADDGGVGDAAPAGSGDVDPEFVPELPDAWVVTAHVWNELGFDCGDEIAKAIAHFGTFPHALRAARFLARYLRAETPWDDVYGRLQELAAHPIGHAGANARRWRGDEAIRSPFRSWMALREFAAEVGHWERMDTILERAESAVTCQEHRRELDQRWGDRRGSGMRW